MVVLDANENNFALLFAESRKSLRPVIFPTDTIFGIGAPISCEIANRKIFGIKNRSEDMPFPILAGSWEQARQIAVIENLSNEKSEFIKNNEKIPTTYIFNARRELHKIYAKTGTVAIRIPNLKWLRDGILLLNEPVTATSANISSEPNAKNFQEAFFTFKEKVSLFLKNMDEGSTGSKIYDLTGKNITQIR